MQRHTAVRLHSTNFALLIAAWPSLNPIELNLYTFRAAPLTAVSHLRLLIKRLPMRFILSSTFETAPSDGAPVQGRHLIHYHYYLLLLHDNVKYMCRRLKGPFSVCDWRFINCQLKGMQIISSCSPRVRQSALIDRWLCVAGHWWTRQLDVECSVWLEKNGGSVHDEPGWLRDKVLHLSQS